MSWFMGEALWGWMPGLLALLDLVLVALTITWALMTKSNSTSAVAWCLLAILLPFLGAILFFFFGYQHVHRRLNRKLQHRMQYQSPGGHHPGSGSFDLSQTDSESLLTGSVADRLTHLADRFGAYPMTHGNSVDFYFDGEPAFADMLESIRKAEHHIHLATFIFHPDQIGKEVLDELTRKSKEGVRVRLLYDAMGSLRLPRSLSPLRRAGGKSTSFMPINLLRRRMQINMRNHRKIMIVDGRVAFMGGLNVGDEYLGRDPRFGFWRDAHLQLRGPAVSDLQHVFWEDWNFASGEQLDEADVPAYFQAYDFGGPLDVQVIQSGPDQTLKGIRELYFAAIAAARRRVWIASPYFVPDDGLLDALRLASHSGLDVRFLGQFYPDKWIPHFAARYYWDQVLPSGVKIYQYARGMMHSKIFLIDDHWASIGTANLDNRSLYLNFEVNCLFHSAEAVKQLESAYLRDLHDSIQLDVPAFGRRPFPARLLENSSRLLSPVL